MLYYLICIKSKKKRSQSQNKELNITKHSRSGCMTSGIIPTRMKVKLSCIATLHSLDTIQNLLTHNQTEAKGYHDNGKNKADMA